MNPEENYYRQCFSTGSGKLVLMNILEEAGLFRKLNTKEELAVENFAKVILHKMGEYGDTRQNRRLMERLFDIPHRKEKPGWLKRNLRKLLLRK